MIHHQILIQARQRPEILERILRIVRHRGFQICAMNMEVRENARVHIDLTIASQRSVDLLFSQLTKLPDVSSVEIQR